MAAKQQVTSDKQQIPRHFVPLASYGCHNGERKATPEYRALNDAWQRKELSGWKLMATPQDMRGRVYVDPNEAATILKSLEEVAVKSNQQEASANDAENTASKTDPAAIEAMFGIHSAIGRLVISVDKVSHMTERLAIAVEQIAKQPLARMDDVAIAEPSGTWRDMNGEAL